MNIIDFIKDDYGTIRKVRTKSIEQLLVAARGLCNFVGYELDLKELNERVLDQWLMELEEKGLANATIAKKRYEIITIWRLAADIGLVRMPKPRLIRSIRKTTGIPDAWQLDEVYRIVEAARSLKGYLCNGIERAGFWEGVVRVCYDTALRKQDILLIRWRHLFYDKGGIECIQSKTGRGIIKVLRPETIDVIKRIEHPKRERIFHWPHSSKPWNDQWNKILKIAGLPVTRRNGLQKIRRTSVSWLERYNPGNASDHLGHVCLALAKRNYIDPRVAYDRDELPPSFSNIPPSLREKPF